MGLTALPPEIGQLTALTELHLSGNQLTALPPEIGQHKALTVLRLAGNPL
jgi:Leucine-rich repeat (LRR) protein